MHTRMAPAETMNSDFEELLSIFNENGVRYLVVSGYAVMVCRYEMTMMPTTDTMRIEIGVA